MPDEQPNGDGGMEDEAPVAAYPIPILGLDEATRQPVTATILVVVLSGGRGMRLVPDPPGLALSRHLRWRQTREQPEAEEREADGRGRVHYYWRAGPTRRPGPSGSGPTRRPGGGDGGTSLTG